MLQPIIEGMGRVLAYFYSIIPNYGLAIILLTVIVRVLMIPLAIKQAHSMQANRGNQEKIRQLAPEVRRIKEKYKHDRARQYEEQKKLYDKHDVNMLGGLSGCVPMLLQAPIFMAMYAVLQGCDKLLGGTCEVGNNIPTGSPLHDAILDGRATFLSMNLNLSPAQVWNEGAFLTLLPYAFLVLVMGVTMFFQSRQMMRMQPAGGDPQMVQTQKIMQFMPLMIVFFSINFPAGLTVYWTASNVWTIGQQFVLLKKVGGSEEDTARQKQDSGKSGLLSGKKPAGGQRPSKEPAKEMGSERPGEARKKVPPKSGAEAPKGRPTPKRPPKDGQAGGKGSGRRAASRARQAGGGKGAAARRPAKSSRGRKQSKGRK